MNEIEKQQYAALFPRASRSFVDANPKLFTSQSEQDSGTALVGEASGKEKVHEVPRVSIVMHRVQLLDPDNAYAATKPIIDCLCQVGLITDDSPSDIDLQVTQEKVAHYNEQRTVVTITPYP